MRPRALSSVLVVAAAIGTAACGGAIEQPPPDPRIASLPPVGVQQGTTGKTYTQEHAPKTAKIPSFPSDAEMYQAIQAGQVDALLQDLPVNLEHTKKGKFVIVEQYDTDESYGLALKKGNTALLKDVNVQLAKLKSSGEYKKLYDKYFAAS